MDELPRVSPGGLEIVEAIAEPLPYNVLAIDGADAVLAVHQSADDPLTLVQRVEATRALGPPVAIVGEHVAQAYDVEGATLVLTTRGRALCLSELVGGVARTRACHDDVRADAVVRLADRLLLVAADVEIPEEEDDEPAQSRKRREERRDADGKKRSAGAPPERSRGRDKRKQARLRSEKATDVLARHKLEITTRGLTWDGALDEEPTKAGVVFEEPMAGMGLVGAGARRTGDGASLRVDVAFYEWAGSIADRTSKAIGRARFGTAVLDEAGALVEASRGKLGESDLYFGFLADALEPRLVTSARGSVLLSQGSARGPCQATVITPSRAPMIGDRDACAFDPGRFVQRAEELRAGAKAKAQAGPLRIAATEGAFKTMAETLTTSGAHRVESQAAWDPIRTVGRAAHGFAVAASGELQAIDRETFEITSLPRPLVARRARAFDAAIAPDGEALVRTKEGLALVATTASVRILRDPLSVEGGEGPPGAGRHDVTALGAAPFAKISDTWWTTRGAPRRLVPAEASPSKGGHVSPLEASVLVGGKEHGLLMEVDGESLAVSTLDGEGRLRRIALGRAPVRPGIDAAASGDGGALLVGPTQGDPRSWTLVRIDPDGRWSSVVVGERTRAAVPRIVAIPGHGARLDTGGGPGEAQLLIDRSGAVVGKWSPGPLDPSTTCVDGTRWPARLPAPRPGAFVEVPALASPSACVVGQPTWSDDGVLRAVVSRRVGSHTSLELVRFEPPPDVRSELLAPGSSAAPAPAAPAPAPATTPTAPKLRARCPADMVLVDDRLCVDRFEGAIAERATGRLASPDYPITPNLFSTVLSDWATKRERAGDLFARTFPLPRPMTFQAQGVAEPIAISRSSVLPSGYLTGLIAKEVCAAAGKRLCSPDEFKTACRGEGKTRFPYGDAYREGACNVARPNHPAAILHGHASIGHLDPRLGRVVLDASGPGLRRTGATPQCASRWGGDAIYDMVGNLDEWLDKEGGAFAGGFYARGSKSGCDAIVDSHPTSYLDYSTGVRCCSHARAP